jgi:hypothetical protein
VSIFIYALTQRSGKRAIFKAALKVSGKPEFVQLFHGYGKNREFLNKKFKSHNGLRFTRCGPLCYYFFDNSSTYQKERPLWK